MSAQSRFVPAQVTLARQEAGFSVERLAQSLGRSPAWVLDLEAGRAVPTNDEWLTMSEVLCKEAAFFMEVFKGTALEGAVLPGGRELARPLDVRMVHQFHTALDRGQLSARKAARLLGMTLHELKTLFPAHGLTAPFEL